MDDLAGTAMGALEEKGRASEGAAGGAAGGTDRAGGKAPSRLCPGDGHRVHNVAEGTDATLQSAWRSVGDVAADLLRNLRRAHGQPLGDTDGVKPRRLATLH